MAPPLAKPTTAIDLGFRLKTHLLNMLGRFGEEVNYQIGTVWADYFDRYIAAQAGAMKNQADALDHAKQVEDDSQQLLNRAMAVLAVASGFAGAWFSASLQYNVSQQFAKLGDGKNVLTNFFSSKLKALATDRVGQKMFGDGGKAAAGYFAGLGIDKFKPSAITFPDANALTAHSYNIEALRRNCNKMMGDAADQIQGNIDELVNAYENDVSWPEKFVAKLYSWYRAPTSPFDLAKQSIEFQLDVGYNQINGGINNLRAQFAKESYYFGNDPSPATNDWIITRKMEYEMWVLFLCQHEAFFNDLTSGGVEGGRTMNMKDAIKRRIVLDRADSWFETLMDHMADLNLPVMQVLTYHGSDRYQGIENLLRWAKQHVPDQQLSGGPFIPRQLEPIETWTRPHSKGKPRLDL